MIFVITVKLIKTANIAIRRNKMFDEKHLQNLIEIIEEPRNYLAGFKSVMYTCTLAEVAVIILWDSGAIGDNEKLAYSSRIKDARAKAIEKHKQHVIKHFKNTTTEHTVESFVETIYGEILG